MSAGAPVRDQSPQPMSSAIMRTALGSGDGAASGSSAKLDMSIRAIKM